MRLKVATVGLRARWSKGAGLTFIEILVTIAIIALLASLVLIPLGRARIKAHNAAIKEDVNQMRVIAENVFDDNGGAGFCGAGLKCASTDPRMTPLKEDADQHNGNAGLEPNLFAGSTFCVEAILRDGTTYCADSNGIFTGTAVDAGTGNCVSDLCQ